jgi:hypothetical protein
MAEEPQHVLLLSMVIMQLVSVILQHKPVKKVVGGIPDSVWAVEEICWRPNGRCRCKRKRLNMVDLCGYYRF